MSTIILFSFNEINIFTTLKKLAIISKKDFKGVIRTM